MTAESVLNIERKRPDEAHRREKDWKRRGAYVSERVRETVREDYFRAKPKNFNRTKTGAITSFFTNTFTAITERVWELAIKPAGLG